MLIPIRSLVEAEGYKGQKYEVEPDGSITLYKNGKAVWNSKDQGKGPKKPTEVEPLKAKELKPEPDSPVAAAGAGKPDKKDDKKDDDKEAAKKAKYGDKYDPYHKWEKPTKWISAGGVVLASEDDLDRVYIRKVAPPYAPDWTFPKGRVDTGESRQKTALREVEEEIGVVAEIVPDGYLGEYEGSSSFTHYFLMFAKKDLGRHDKETAKVLLATWTEAVHKLAKTGNSRDLKVLQRAMDVVEKIRRKRQAQGVSGASGARAG